VDWLYAFCNWLRAPDNLTAISTLAIAAFTVVLAIVGYSQARLLRKSVDLARDEFVAAHRPRIVLRDVHLEGDEILYMLVNVGETTATIVESWIIAETILVKSAVRPLRSAGHNDLGSLRFAGGEIKDLTFSVPSDLGLVSGFGDRSGSIFMGERHFAGTIVYTDDLGVRRRSVFRRRWHNGDSRFIRLNSEDERDNEYAD
jgi:hypothetical protein